MGRRVWSFLNEKEALRWSYPTCGCQHEWIGDATGDKKIDPEVVTVLLTGHTDFESAMSAVNDGNIFSYALQTLPTSNLK